MSTVSFTRMRDGTQADYDLLHHYEQEFINGLADRVLEPMARILIGSSRRCCTIWATRCPR